jgi:hypothetical protein
MRDVLPVRTGSATEHGVADNLRDGLDVQDRGAYQPAPEINCICDAMSQYRHQHTRHRAHQQ